MVGSAVDRSAASVLARLTGVLDELHSLELSTLSDTELLGFLQDWETHKRRCTPLDHRLVAELGSRGLAGEHACRDTATLLSQLLRISASEAGGRVRDAADLGPRRGPTGAALPPVFARVAAAQAAGSICAAHARIITATIDALPAAVQAEHDESVQDFLLEQAHLLDPKLLAVIARRISDTLDPEGTRSTEHDQARRRELTISQRPDGSAQLHGELNAIGTEALLAVLDTLARPAPAADGQRDPRTARQRRHDGLQDAMLMLLKSEQLPDCGGVAATIILTITEEQAETRTGLVTTGHGAQISITQALSLAGDARIMPVTLTKTRRITGYGTAHRIFTETQRLAMTARDKGCSFPTCTAPPTWCQAHHITDFAITRRTSVDDATLLCGFHHREHPKLGWTCQMINGTPHWTPPTWIDPTQTPRRNRTHDPHPHPVPL
jgi:hypothetical protein